MKSIILLLLITAATARRNKCTSSYTQLPHGQTPYENDGGCYFCAKFVGSTFPISNLNDLSNNCKQMCDSDPECTAYTIARQASLHAHEYYWGGSANCCLEREEYPPETYINAQNNDSDEEPNICEKESMCWTRFEKNTTVVCDKKQKKAKTKKSKLCSPIWKARKFTEKKIKKHVDFIKGGCQYKSETFISMLDEAYQQCKAEIEEEAQNTPQQLSVTRESSAFIKTDGKQSAWLAHGVIGAITFGLLAPLSAFCPSFPSLIPTEAHTAIRVGTFALTFVTVLIAFGTNEGLGDTTDSDVKESHQIVGLALLLLLCLQTLVSIYREEKSALAEKLLTVSALFVFGLGVIEVRSGCYMFASDYNAVYWGQVYLGYIFWLLFMVLGGKLVMKYRGGKSRIEYTHVHTKAFELT